MPGTRWVGDVPRSIRYRRLGIAAGILAVLIVLALWVGAALTRPLPVSSVDVQAPALPTPAAATLVEPTGSVGAVTVAGEPGLLASWGPQTPRPTASMAKTITALVVLDAHPVSGSSGGPTITFTQADIDVWRQVQAAGGSNAPVVAGERLTLEQALTAMVLPSANNYAVSISRWAFGSDAGYVAAANAWLAREHLTGTHVADASGRDPGTVATPWDLVQLGRLAVEDPALSRIVDTTTADLPGAGTVRNSNRLLGGSDALGVDGVKTGFTPEAGHSLLFAADVRVPGGGRRQVVGLVAGMPDYDSLFAGARTLIESVRDGYRSVPAVRGGARYGSVATAWGERIPVVAASARRVAVYGDAPLARSVTVHDVATVRRGARVGSVAVTVNGRTFTSTLVAARAARGPDLWWRLAHPLP